MMSILLSIALACSPQEKYADKCNTVCEQDGDKKGIVVNGECGCWNPRPIGKVPFKINRDFKGKVDITPERSLYD